MSDRRKPKSAMWVETSADLGRARRLILLSLGVWLCIGVVSVIQNGGIP